MKPKPTRASVRGSSCVPRRLFSSVVLFGSAILLTFCTCSGNAVTEALVSHNHRTKLSSANFSSLAQELSEWSAIILSLWDNNAANAISNSSSPLDDDEPEVVWTDWAPCSAHCDGVSTRYQLCANNAADCSDDDDDIEVRRCNVNACEAASKLNQNVTIYSFDYYTFSNLSALNNVTSPAWSNWSSCTAPCNGLSSRYEVCDDIDGACDDRVQVKRCNASLTCATTRQASTLNVFGTNATRSAAPGVAQLNIMSSQSASYSSGSGYSPPSASSSYAPPSPASISPPIPPPSVYPQIITQSGWTPWSCWSQCTRVCGGGHSFRVRQCIHRSDDEYNALCADGLPFDVQTCNTQPCKFVPNVVPVWSPWTKFTACSEKCGPGFQVRFRFMVCSAMSDYCNAAQLEMQTCNNGNCQYDQTMWSNYDVQACPERCGGAVALRTRKCNRNLPDWPVQCPGSTYDFSLCAMDPCLPGQKQIGPPPQPPLAPPPSSQQNKQQSSYSPQQRQYSGPAPSYGQLQYNQQQQQQQYNQQQQPPFGPALAGAGLPIGLPPPILGGAGFIGPGVGIGLPLPIGLGFGGIGIGPAIGGFGFGGGLVPPPSKPGRPSSYESQSRYAQATNSDQPSSSDENDEHHHHQQEQQQHERQYQQQQQNTYQPPQQSGPMPQYSYDFQQQNVYAPRPQQDERPQQQNLYGLHGSYEQPSTEYSANAMQSVKPDAQKPAHHHRLLHAQQQSQYGVPQFDTDDENEHMLSQEQYHQQPQQQQQTMNGPNQSYMPPTNEQRPDTVQQQNADVQKPAHHHRLQHAEQQNQYGPSFDTDNDEEYKPSQENYEPHQLPQQQQQQYAPENSYQQPPSYEQPPYRSQSSPFRHSASQQQPQQQIPYRPDDNTNYNYNNQPPQQQPVYQLPPPPQPKMHYYYSNQHLPPPEYQQQPHNPYEQQQQPPPYYPSDSQNNYPPAPPPPPQQDYSQASPSQGPQYQPQNMSNYDYNNNNNYQQPQQPVYQPPSLIPPTVYYYSDQQQQQPPLYYPSVDIQSNFYSAPPPEYQQQPPYNPDEQQQQPPPYYPTDSQNTYPAPPPPQQDYPQASASYEQQQPPQQPPPYYLTDSQNSYPPAPSSPQQDYSQAPPSYEQQQQQLHPPQQPTYQYPPPDNNYVPVMPSPPPSSYASPDTWMQTAPPADNSQPQSSNDISQQYQPNYAPSPPLQYPTYTEQQQPAYDDNRPYTEQQQSDGYSAPPQPPQQQYDPFHLNASITVFEDDGISNHDDVEGTYSNQSASLNATAEDSSSNSGRYKRQVYIPSRMAAANQYQQQNPDDSKPNDPAPNNNAAIQRALLFRQQPPVQYSPNLRQSPGENVQFVQPMRQGQEHLYGVWSIWTPCSVPCGPGGYQDSIAVRPCRPDIDGPNVNDPSVCPLIAIRRRACGWSPPCVGDTGRMLPWSGYTGCSVECGQGIRARFRMPYSEMHYDGEMCNEPFYQIISCDTGRQCPPPDTTIPYLPPDIAAVGQQQQFSPYNRMANANSQQQQQQEGTQTDYGGDVRRVGGSLRLNAPRPPPSQPVQPPRAVASQSNFRPETVTVYTNNQRPTMSAVIQTQADSGPSLDFQQALAQLRQPTTPQTNYKSSASTSPVVTTHEQHQTMDFDYGDNGVNVNTAGVVTSGDSPAVGHLHIEKSTTTSSPAPSLTSTSTTPTTPTKQSALLNANKIRNFGALSLPASPDPDDHKAVATDQQSSVKRQRLTRQPGSAALRVWDGVQQLPQTAQLNIAAAGNSSNNTNQRTPPFSFVYGWSNWGPWSNCSNPCDGGIQTRHRNCIAIRVPTNTAGTNTTVTTVPTKHLKYVRTYDPDNDNVTMHHTTSRLLVDRDGVIVGVFSNDYMTIVDNSLCLVFSNSLGAGPVQTTCCGGQPCSATLLSNFTADGNSTQASLARKTRNLDTPSKYNSNSTSTVPVKYTWTKWSGYSACTASCGGGLRYKLRHCLATTASGDVFEEDDELSTKCGDERARQIEPCDVKPCAPLADGEPDESVKVDAHEQQTIQTNNNNISADAVFDGTEHFESFNAIFTCNENVMQKCNNPSTCKYYALCRCKGKQCTTGYQQNESGNFTCDCR